MGYQTYKKRIALATGRPIDVGTLILKPLAQQLSEVKVVKRKPLVEQKLDRLVFHAEDVAGAEGGDALDVLELAPRLLVSQDQVSIAGKGAVRFDDTG